MAERERPARATTETTHVQSVRVRDGLRARIDALAVALRERPPYLRVSRSNVLLSIIEAGLAVLEKDLVPQPPGTRDETPGVVRARRRRSESDASAGRKKSA